VVSWSAEALSHVNICAVAFLSSQLALTNRIAAAVQYACSVCCNKDLPPETLLDTFYNLYLASIAASWETMETLD
jgi:hypothetical protein